MQAEATGTTLGRKKIQDAAPLVGPVAHLGGDVRDGEPHGRAPVGDGVGGSETSRVRPPRSEPAYLEPLSEPGDLDILPTPAYADPAIELLPGPARVVVPLKDVLKILGRKTNEHAGRLTRVDRAQILRQSARLWGGQIGAPMTTPLAHAREGESLCSPSRQWGAKKEQRVEFGHHEEGHPASIVGTTTSIRNTTHCR